MWDETWMVAIGDCFNGLSFYGPFDEFDEAQAWAEGFCSSECAWHIVSLNKEKPSCG
jgi:hypothetical protein